MIDTDVQADPGSNNSLNTEKLPVEKFLLVGVAVLSFVLTLFAFLPGLGSRFLLDEQFMAAWSKALLSGSAAGGWASYLSWSGADAQDAFGPIASLSCVFLSQLGSGLARLSSMVVHAGCSLALYLVSRKLTADFDAKTSLFISIFAALIFAVHPLSAELINFVGATGIELSVLFFALSFNFYLSAHPVWKAGEQSTARKNSILSVVFFVCAYLAYAKSWYLLKIVAMFEVLNFALDPVARSAYKSLFKDASTPGRKRFFITIGSLMAASIAFMTVEFARGTDPIGALMAMMPNGLKCMLLATMFPINRSLWKKYSPEYVVLYIVFGLAAALSAYGVWRNPKYRVALAQATAWVFFGLLVGGNQSLVADDFYGHRYLAHAQAGVCILLPMLCFGLASALNQKRLWAAAPGALVCLVFMIASGRHSFAQSQHYKNSSRLLEKIQKSAAIICAKEKSPYCIAKDVPRQIAFVPCVSPYRPILLDAKNGLMRAPIVSGGPLKDALAAGRLTGSTSRWDQTFDSLVPVVVEPKVNEPAFALNAEQLGEALNPPLQFWKTVGLDKKEESLKVASNSEHEPGISMFSRVLSPIDGDAFYIDAKISTPVQPANPNVELHWMTLHTNNYEKEDRRAVVLAQMNDNAYHRYLFSLRGTGWTTNGPSTQITLGFPSSSTVDIKGIGIINDKNIYAQFKNVGAGKNTAKSRFCDLCFDYPDDADLGLFQIGKSSNRIDFTYDVSAIAGSAGAILFTSQANQLNLLGDSGEIPHNSQLKLDLKATSGTVSIALDQFAKTGIYGLRIAALDSTGKPVGMFSDRIWLLVDKSQ